MAATASGAYRKVAIPYSLPTKPVCRGSATERHPRMTVYITARRMEGGSGHEHIAHVKWENRASTEKGKSSRAVMVDFIDNKAGEARVDDGTSFVRVITVAANPKYIRTVSDGTYTDNLLSLPTF